MTFVSTHGDLCIFPVKPSLLAVSGHLSGYEGDHPIFLIPERHPQMLAQAGPSWELRLGGLRVREPGTALGRAGVSRWAWGHLGGRA